VSHDVPRRALGRTGEQVSAIGLGGWHLALSHVNEASSLEIVRTAIDRGITFMDNCWDYNDGASEIRMGKALRDGYRQKAFLMTKIDGRSRKEAARQLDESLRRLQTDCIDLVQHHEIIRYEDPHRVFDEEGAHRALEDARQAGKLRYVGFTGHKDPRIFLYMLEMSRERGIRFDAVQMPLSELREGRAPRARERRHRRPRDEVDGQRDHPQIGDGDGARMPAVRAPPPHVSGHHGD
jgi:aryl-alcohol dehydrogenase-like predicted oxidoreductase